ncbi:MAG: 1-deoxy-D-xylulose-5-phosphate reductoisomerase, partial [Clostridiales bacterium]|nr:1-deoxy-D-xylulose-5-phosphate reductoisomerase [Clostridiales bacterium]
MRRLSVLGSTGSIGTQTLEVVRNDPGNFDVVGLTCGSDIDLLFEQIREFDPEAVSVRDEEKASELKDRIRSSGLRTEVLCGEEGNIAVACLDRADTCVGAIVGASGLRPTYEAICKGKDIALANKETLVAGGDVIMPLIKEKGVSLLPIDSEHCAIWQCLWGEKAGSLDRILITASGGPFRGRSRDDLKDVTVEQALGHPTWKMGGKITIDSSTMMNKGLEVIEASHLFGIGVDRIDVVVHPQSVIHSMIRTRDGSVLAQMGKPSMILPIMVALYYPERGNRILEEFDPFASGMNDLTFEKCDTSVFGLLDLAYDAGRKRGLLPCIMNAANEVSVYAFLDGKIGFLDIERAVRQVYEYFEKRDLPVSGLDLDDVLGADREARKVTEEII